MDVTAVNACARGVFHTNPNVSRSAWTLADKKKAIAER